MPSGARVLAIDLGTSRVKVALVDETLRTLAGSSVSYATLRDASGKAEQRPLEWLEGIRSATRAVLSGEADGPRVDAVVLTAQMPTLVALGDDGRVLGNAVTWQDARADALVVERFDADALEHIAAVAGTPMDGRYLLPMELRRVATGEEPATMLLSAKDYVLDVLTGRRVTDPSTASGFGNFDLARTAWSEDLSRRWGFSVTQLPEIVAPDAAIGLSFAGATILEGVAPGTPVVVGAADSVCAHHYVSHFFPASVSVINGSSTVVMATLEGPNPPRVLVTPLVDPRQRGGEMDLLATGSSLSWLADVLGVTTVQLEEMALGDPRPASNEVLVRPYLSRGEQGALWRSDLTGSIEGLSLGVTRADLALALYEGIAFETARCIRLLASVTSVRRIVSLASPTSHHLGAALLGALGEVPVVALGQQSPSLLGAALIALEHLGATAGAALSVPESDVTPVIDQTYASALVRKAEHYLATTPPDLTPRA